MNAVVITRPAGQAEALARKIAAIGRETVVFPLLDIQPLGAEAAAALEAELARLHDYALAAFVSPNAIDAAFARIGDWPSAVAIAVIGEGSRRALARHGVTDANATIVSPRRTDRTDSQTLLDEIDPAMVRGRRVLIVRGETGRELLADALREAGARVTQIAAYRRLAPALDAGRAEQLRRLLCTGHDWVITSSEALRNLLELAASLGSDEYVPKLQRQLLVVPHERIKESAETLGFRTIRLTGSGDDSLIAALQSPL